MIQRLGPKVSPSPDDCTPQRPMNLLNKGEVPRLHALAQHVLPRTSLLPTPCRACAASLLRHLLHDKISRTSQVTMQEGSGPDSLHGRRASHSGARKPRRAWEWTAIGLGVHEPLLPGILFYPTGVTR